MKKESIDAIQTEEKCPKCKSPMILTDKYDGAGHRAYICPKCKFRALKK